MRLSFIIVNYNVTDLLAKCISSIQKYTDVSEYEIVVVDNASPDTSWRELATDFPQVKFIASENNGGFAKANNKAITHAKGEYILLLNPDTELEEHKIKQLLNFADNQNRLGCIGVRMHDAQGVFLPESKRSVPDMFNAFEKLFTGIRKNAAKSYYRNDLAENAVAEVEVVTGAFLLMKKKLYIEIGGLDERYFMYGEDIDLCYTLLQKGYKNWYYGKMSILHHKGESTVKDNLYFDRFYGAMQIFIDKYYRQNPLQHGFLSAGLKMRHTWDKIKINKKAVQK